MDVLDGPSECAEDIRLWSNPKDWDPALDPNAREVGIQPLEDGINVKIPSGWNMHFDLDVSPKFDLLEINGCLTFAPKGDHHL
jgi:hypothetical protein